MFVLIKTMYLSDLFQINTKIILNLPFINYIIVQFLFLFSWLLVGRGGGEGAEVKPPSSICGSWTVKCLVCHTVFSLIQFFHGSASECQHITM